MRTVPELSAKFTRASATRALELGAITLVLLLGTALRLELLAERTLWHDEAFSLAVARKPAGYILRHLPAADPHPPGYYLLLRSALVLFGDSLAVARGLSAVLGVLAVWLVWALGRRLFDPATGIAAAALVALHPFQIFASNEIRMYPLATCLALLSTWAAWWAVKNGRMRDWATYGLSLAAMAYVSYYTVVVALGQWAVLLRHRRGLAVALAVGALIYSPWLGSLPGDTPGIVFVRETPELRHALELLATQAYGGYLFGTTTYLSGSRLDAVQHGMLLVPFLLLIAVGSAATWKTDRHGAALVSGVWLGGVLAAVLASVAVGHLAAYPRHLVFLQPFAALLIGAGIVHLKEIVERAPKAVVVGAAAVVVLSFVGPAVANLQGSREYQVLRYDRAAAYVRHLYRPGDALVFYQGGARRVFREYFDPGGVQIAIDPDFARWSREGMRPVLRQAVEPLRLARGRVWLVLVWPYPENSPLDLIEAIEGFGYRRVTRQNFNGVEVVVLTRPARR
jgi:4-amino-4-deoxy-L-arabinose transferase-like glycosyltransferase